MVLHVISASVTVCTSHTVVPTLTNTADVSVLPLQIKHVFGGHLNTNNNPDLMVLSTQTTRTLM